MQNLLDKINQHPRATLLVAGSSIFGIATVIILVMIVSLHNTVVNPIITPEEENLVLSEVIKNNPKDLINNNKTPNNSSNPIPTSNQIPIDNAEAGGNNIDTQPEPPVAPNLNEYNYRNTKVTYSRGPAYEVCKTYMDGGGMQSGYSNEDNTVTEYTEYFERYYTARKTITREDNKLFSFYINKYGRDINSSTFYLEGDYAVENIYKPYSEFDSQQDALVVSYPTVTVEEIIKSYFGSNAAITNIIFENNTKYYIIQNSYTTYCDPSYNPYLVTNNPVPPLNNLITVYKVNGSTFSIEESKRYIEEVKDQNLIDVSTTSVTRSMVNSQQVASEFRLATNIDIVKNDYTNITYNYDNAKNLVERVDYLASIGSNILLPSGNEDALSYIYITNFTDPDSIDTQYFYKDRNFFPATSWGETLFNRWNPINIDTGLVYSVSLSEKDNRHYALSVYEGRTLDYVLESNLKSIATSISISDVNMDINNATVSAKKISRVLMYNYPTSYGVSYPTSYTGSITTTKYDSYIFELDNKVYVISYHDYNNQMNFDSKSFELLELGTESEIIDAKIYILNMYNTQLQWWNPVSYPISFPVSYVY